MGAHTRYCVTFTIVCCRYCNCNCLCRECHIRHATPLAKTSGALPKGVGHIQRRRQNLYDQRRQDTRGKCVRAQQSEALHQTGHRAVDHRRTQGVLLRVRRPAWDRQDLSRQEWRQQVFDRYQRETAPVCLHCAGWLQQRQHAGRTLLHLRRLHVGADRGHSDGNRMHEPDHLHRRAG